MFTGIVQGLKAVVSREATSAGERLRLLLGELAAGVELGASVAVNGTCLTVAAVEDGVVAFDVIPETLALTNLGDLSVGTLVNVERSYRVGDEVGGHVVSGHVSGVAQVASRQSNAKGERVWLTVPSETLPALMHKGFVALDGASLTISDVDRELGGIEVSLIPETLERTTFGRLAVGDRVNLEVDAQTAAVVETVRSVLESDDWLDKLVARLEQRRS